MNLKVPAAIIEKFGIYAAAIFADTKFLRDDRRKMLE